MAKLGETGSTDPASISPTDLHAQSAMILGHVNRLPDVQAASMYALYGYGHEKKVSIELLEDQMYPALKESVPNKKLVGLCMRNWLDKNPSVRRIAADFGVSYRKAYHWRNVVMKHWAGITVPVLNKLEGDMFGDGKFGYR